MCAFAPITRTVRAKASYGRDRFVHLGEDVLGIIDLYLSEVGVRAVPRGHHLWAVVGADAEAGDGASWRSHPPRVPALQPEVGRVNHTAHAAPHARATALVRSFLAAGDRLLTAT